MSTPTLLAIKYTSGTPSTLQILDQLKLPHETIYLSIVNTTRGWTAIQRMQVRGAPAIAIVAALSLAVELSNLLVQQSDELSTAEATTKFINEKLDYLVTSRPTAVNLADAAGKLKTVVDEAAAAGLGGAEIAQKYISTAEEMVEKDVADNKAIGDYGAEWIRQAAGKTDGISVLTHCNTGSLATAGYGTALGIIRSLFAQGSLTHAYCTETRPYNQGSRLTAYELVFEKIPATLITDNMAAALLSQRDVAAIVVGADRVAANGDTANKIGTYQLALLARALGVKFVVAAPTTSIDLNTPSGKEIKIEERPGWEVLTSSGPRVDGYNKETGDVYVDLDRVQEILHATRGIGTWNPAFDVTPAELIDAIVTETGVVVKDGTGSFPVADAFK